MLLRRTRYHLYYRVRGAVLEVLAEPFEHGARRFDLSEVGPFHPGLDLRKLRVVKIERFVAAGREHNDLLPFGKRALGLDSTFTLPASDSVHSVRIALRADSARAQGCKGRVLFPSIAPARLSLPWPWQQHRHRLEGQVASIEQRRCLRIARFATSRSSVAP